MTTASTCAFTYPTTTKKTIALLHRCDQRGAEEVRCLDQMGERRAYFLPTSCFQSAVRIDPYPLWGEDLENMLQFPDQFLRGRHARRGDLIDAKTHVIWVAIGDAVLSQLKWGTRGFHQGYVGAHAGKARTYIAPLRCTI